MKLTRPDTAYIYYSPVLTIHILELGDFNHVIIKVESLGSRAIQEIGEK